MNIINHRVSHVNPQHLALVSALAARLHAGAYERCACCLSWADHKTVKAVSLYLPKDDRQPVAYAICKRCARQLLASPEQALTLTHKIETYLDGGEA